MDHGHLVDELFEATQTGNIQQLKVLLDSNESFANQENNAGLTPLGYAAHFGNLEAVKLLIDYGAEINALSHSKVSFIPSNTALHAAIAGERDIEVIETLLKHKADPNMLDSNGHTALMTAAFHDDNIEIIRLLVENGADVHTQTEEGETALSICSQQGNKNVEKILQEYGAR